MRRSRVVVLVLVGMAVIRVLMKLVDRLLERSKSLASLHVYIRSMVRVGLWFLLVLMAAGSLGIDVTSIIALLSVAGLAVSLALQNTLSNLAGGIMLLVTKPFQVGDYVGGGRSRRGPSGGCGSVLYHLCHRGQ